MTPHISAKKGEIASSVIMPGDPLRAKMIAEKYLDNYKLVSDVRNIYAYTGTYKGKEITVMASGMGMPSMGIYSYELFKFYDVDNIIRIGSCGSNNENIKILDVILSESVYTEGNFAYTFNSSNTKEVEANKELNNVIIDTASKNNVNLKIGKTSCVEVFDAYILKLEEFINRTPKDVLANEMEAFALFYIAKCLNKKASCLMTVVDSRFDETVISSIDRQNSLTKMIELALESILNL